MAILFWLLVSLIALLVSVMAVTTLEQWLTYLPLQVTTPPHPPKPANDNSRLARVLTEPARKSGGAAPR